MANNNPTPQMTRNNTLDLESEVYFNTDLEDATSQLYALVPREVAESHDWEIVHTMNKEVITGCTGSEYLITEWRELGVLVEITGDSEWEITAYLLPEHE